MQLTTSGNITSDGVRRNQVNVASECLRERSSRKHLCLGCSPVTPCFRGFPRNSTLTCQILAPDKLDEYVFRRRPADEAKMPAFVRDRLLRSLSFLADSHQESRRWRATGMVETFSRRLGCEALLALSGLYPQVSFHLLGSTTGSSGHLNPCFVVLSCLSPSNNRDFLERNVISQKKNSRRLVT